MPTGRPSNGIRRRVGTGELPATVDHFDDVHRIVVRFRFTGRRGRITGTVLVSG
jgi:hypothetical protein